MMKHAHRPKLVSVTDELFEYRSVERMRLKFTMAITGTVMVVEIIGGLMSNSLALISDAGHMFTHFFALLISFGAILCAGRQTCSYRTFGFFRVEILAALFNSVFLFAVTAWILFEGIVRMLRPAPVMSTEMFFIALLGLVVNLASALILYGAHQESLNIKSALLHMWADTVSSIAIVIGAVVIRFTGWDIIDPVLSILIAVLIVGWGWNLFRDSVHILLESVPRGMDSDEVASALREAIPEIDEITDLHIWEITSKMYSMTAHVMLRGAFTCEASREILRRIKEVANDRFDIEHTTIEIDQK